MKIYHMIIEPAGYFPGTAEAVNRRREYQSPHQGKAPEGWRAVAVCGYHETPTNDN